LHIPDGFIPLSQVWVYWTIAVIFVARALKWSREEMSEGAVPLFATLAAGIFAVQAMNIPVPWGTSGHMVGGVLAAILLGSPWAGVLLLSLVVIIQGLLFADGGLTVMGANILNMGIISTFVGYYLYRFSLKITRREVASFFGAWMGLFVSALAVAVELSLAGTFPLKEGLIFMGLYHLVIGLLAEGVITAVVVTTVPRIAPELFPALKEARA